MKLFSSRPKWPPLHLKTLVHGAWLREKGRCPESGAITQSLTGSRIADFTLELIWVPGQPTIWPGRKLPRYATFRQIKGPR